MAQHFRCELCHEEFTAKDMNVDHILPAVDPDKGFETWDIFIDRLFCEKDNLQAICVPCHKIKTLAEKKGRNGNRQKD